MSTPSERTLSKLLEELAACLGDTLRSTDVLKLLSLNVITFEDELEVLESFMHQLDWSLLSETQFYLWKDFLMDIVTAFPHFSFVCAEAIVVSYSRETPGRNQDDEDFYRACAINSLLQVSPDCVQHLLDCLRKHCPHSGRNEAFLLRHQRSLLYLAEAIECLRGNIWSLIIDRLIAFDSDIPRGTLSQFYETLSILKRDRVPISEILTQSAYQTTSSQEILSLAGKLDTLLLDFMNRLCDPALYSDKTTKKTTIKSLINLFITSVLPIYDLGCVQYVWFHLSATIPKFLKKMVVALWKTFEDPSVSTQERQMSIFYIGGLISRVKNVDPEFVRSVISEMSVWCNRYHAGTLSTFPIVCKRSKHILFYSIFQSLMYSLVYICQDVILDGCPRLYMNWCNFFTSLDLGTLIHSQVLNPLAYCHHRVVDIFANVTAKLQLIFCYTVIQRNKRLISLMKPRNTASSFASSSSDHEDVYLSDPSFYPYDPLMLPLSGTFVDPNYRHWKDTNDNSQCPNQENGQSIEESKTGQGGTNSFEKFIEDQLEESFNLEHSQMNLMEQILA